MQLLFWERKAYHVETKLLIADHVGAIAPVPQLFGGSSKSRQVLISNFMQLSGDAFPDSEIILAETLPWTRTRGCLACEIRL